MVFKQKSYNFSNIAIDFKLGLKDYSELYNNGTRLKEFLLNQSMDNDIKSGRTPSKFNPDYWNGEYEFITMSDVDTITYELNTESVEKITDEAIDNEKTLYQAKAGSLIISNAMTLGLAFMIDRSVYINQNVFELILNEEKINKKFLMWYFNSIIRRIFQSTFSSKYLSKAEVGMLTIPDIEVNKQIKFEEDIKPIEQEIKSLKKDLLTEQEIINSIFQSEFGFNYSTFNELNKIKKFNVESSCFGNNVDLRNSPKFHRKAEQFVFDELAKITKRKIKNYLAQPICLGKSISPVDYDVNGQTIYISMADIKTWHLNSEEAKAVTDTYAEDNISKTVIRNDIIMARSGEGTIGKVAIVEEEVNGVFADFTMRIRLKNYNPLFAYYYFRTSYFQYLIEINKKGLGNNTNIFPSQIEELPIIEIDQLKQERIVELIQKKIYEQNIVITKINSKKAKIEKLLKMCLEEG